MVDVEWIINDTYQEAIENRRLLRDKTKCDTSRIEKRDWGEYKGKYVFGIDHDSKPKDKCPLCGQVIIN